MIPGRATGEGTRRFARRTACAEGHFRKVDRILVSSVGLGTYLGAEDSETDDGYKSSIAIALECAVNVFDSAINYRGQRSERAIGRALAKAIAAGTLERQEVFVSTKGGYLPHDAEDPREPRRYILETFVASGIAPKNEVAEGGNCISPGYLRDQLDRSRANLDLETIDLYYLHNVESQKAFVGADEFRRRLAAAVEMLEEAAGAGKIVRWGLATWDGLRVPPEHPEHLSLADVSEIAREVGGEKHHFCAVQLPFNLAMAQALAYPSQQTAEGRVPALTAAAALGLAVFGSATLLQGRLTEELPEEVAGAFPEAATPAQQALQFSRSAPGMVTSLVGASRPEHARDDFGLCGVAPAAPERVLALFE
jgi:aryl-alcohol dehydrogenase-like predicted oxidoreductase